MKASVSSNYPESRTTLVRAKVSSASSSYRVDKTASVKVIKPAAISYPLHKTAPVALKNVSFFSSAAAPAIRQREAISQNYPSQKTINILFKAVPPALSAASSKKENIPDYQPMKTAAVTLKTNGVSNSTAIPISAPAPAKTSRSVKESGKALADPQKKQPAFLVLIVICLLFILSSGILGWMYWQQYKQMDLLLADKQKLEELTGLKVDDIIGGGLKNNDAFALTTDEIADAEFIRICFSANGSQYSQAGEKTFFVRLVNPENKVVLSGENQTTYINGKPVECTFAKKVNYVNEELFICQDMAKPEGLMQGNYKIEVYSNGLIKGEGSFTLK